jgi:hypothetical protein
MRQDAVAPGDEVAVAGAVLLEGLRGLVGLAAVELDDEALLWPEGVDEEGPSGALVRGRGRSSASRKARKRSSSSLLVIVRRGCFRPRTS